MFVDSNHAGDNVSSRSRSSFLTYMNIALVQRISKKQSTVETSVFGTELVTMKQSTDAVRGLRYKLRMMGIPISSHSYIYGDSASAVHNTSRPESVLKKKSNPVFYNAVHELVAVDESLIGHIPSK